MSFMQVLASFTIGEAVIVLLLIIVLAQLKKGAG